MHPILTFLLLLTAGVLFALATFGWSTGRVNAVAGGLLALTIAVWLGPAFVALF